MDCRGANCEINAGVVIYTGPDLPKINVFSRDRLDTILGRLNGFAETVVKSVNGIKPVNGNVILPSGSSGSEIDPVFTNWLLSNPFSDYLLSSVALATYVPKTLTISINGQQQNLSTSRSWTFNSNSKLTSSFVAGETIGGAQAVMLVGNTIYKFNINSNLNYGKCIGVTDAAVVSGNSVNVVTEGECNQSGGLVAGTLYYAGSTPGSLSSTLPTTGIVQPIGLATNSTTIVVKIQKPYVRI